MAFWSFVLGAVATVVTSILGYFYQLHLSEVLILIFLQWIFIFCFEIRFQKSASDDIFGAIAPALRKEPALLVEIQRTATHALEARKLSSVVIDRHLDRVLEQARNSVAELANGTLRVDLGPGGRRLPDLVELCRHKYQGVSLVNLEQYWHGPVGRESLKKTKKAIADHKVVERIFIEKRDQLPVLARFVKEHVAIGVNCFIVVFEDVDASLRKDFAIIDDGEAAVNLSIDSDRTSTEANYCVNKEGAAGCAQLKELRSIWSSLMDNAQDAEEFLKAHP